MSISHDPIGRALGSKFRHVTDCQGDFSSGDSGGDDLIEQAIRVGAAFAARPEDEAQDNRLALETEDGCFTCEVEGDSKDLDAFVRAYGALGERRYPIIVLTEQPPEKPVQGNVPENLDAERMRSLLDSVASAMESLKGECDPAALENPYHRQLVEDCCRVCLEECRGGNAINVVRSVSTLLHGLSERGNWEPIVNLRRYAARLGHVLAGSAWRKGFPDWHVAQEAYVDGLSLHRRVTSRPHGLAVIEESRDGEVLATEGLSPVPSSHGEEVLLLDWRIARLHNQLVKPMMNDERLLQMRFRDIRNAAAAASGLEVRILAPHSGDNVAREVKPPKVGSDPAP